MIPSRVSSGEWNVVFLKISSIISVKKNIYVKDMQGTNAYKKR